VQEKVKNAPDSGRRAKSWYFMIWFNGLKIDL
jgi:hypothetical protein